MNSSRKSIHAVRSFFGGIPETLAKYGHAARDSEKRHTGAQNICTEAPGLPAEVSKFL